jgi:DNA uptake protein ComE-like DNA-binding protein
MRSLSGVETNLSINTASQSQLEAIPGIGSKAAWRIVSNRAKASRKFPENPFSDVKTALQDAGVQSYGLALKVLKA